MIEQDKFSKALSVVLGEEGGFVNNPVDPGGVTNRGVTQRIYDWWRHQHGYTPQSVKLIAQNEVTAIYKQGYWTPMHCDEFQYPLALMLFDTAVQWGVNDAFSQIIALAIDLPESSEIPVILNRLRTFSGMQLLLNRIYDRRVEYRNNVALRHPARKIFLKGWLLRDENLRNLALKALASSKSQVLPTAATQSPSPSIESKNAPARAQTQAPQQA